MLVQTRKTLLAISWDPGTDQSDVHDLSREMAQEISETWGVLKVRMQIFATPRPGHGRKWTDEDLIEEIRKFNKENGRPPMIKDWNKPGPWPNRKTVQARFGSWANAIEAAGFPRPKGGAVSVFDQLFQEQMRSQ